MLHGETWEVQLAAMGLGHGGRALWSFTRQESALHCIEEDLVMKPRTGKQLLEHSGGKWPGWQWQSGWAWKIAKDLESPVQKCTIWKPLWSDTVYIYIYLFISLASRVYSVNSLFCLACIRCWFHWNFWGWPSAPLMPNHTHFWRSCQCKSTEGLPYICQKVLWFLSEQKSCMLFGKHSW